MIGSALGEADEVAQLWERAARDYDAIYDARRGRGWVARARLAAAAELVGAGPGRALDVGMGAGRLCLELARRRWTVDGIDPSSAMVALARKRLPDASERLVVGRAEELPYADASFDAVVALGSLEYASDLHRALAELARALRPGGLAVVSWPNVCGAAMTWRRVVAYPAARAAKRVVPFGRPAPLRPRRVLGRAAFLALLEASGLTPERVIFIGPRGKRHGTRLGPALAAQLLVSARR